MSRTLDILDELTEIAATAGHLSSRTGRYARTPDFRSPAFTSTRPISDRGSTFHFRHTTKSKRNDISENNRTQTTSSAHQGYIERPSAVERISSESERILISDDYSLPDRPHGILHEGFAYPARSVTPGRASFGTLGKTRSERTEFWTSVELAEGKNSRVQCRIIAELPVELDEADRCAAVRDFCATFEDKSLPYWATIHAPGPRNDKRNFHLHVTYFDRPSGVRDEGSWDFTIRVAQRKKNRSIVFRRPYLNKKLPETRSISWPKTLRRAFSDSINFYLAQAGHSKRYDPRSYKDSGIRKEPTEHLGNKISALESMGLDTDPGIRNAKREIRWSVSQHEKPWRTRADAFLASEFLNDPFLETAKADLTGILNTGITTSRRAASLDIAAALLLERPKRRLLFIEEESRRLKAKSTERQSPDTHATIVSLDSEHEALSARLPSMMITAEKCRKKSSDLQKDVVRLLREFDHKFHNVDPERIFTGIEENAMAEFEEQSAEVDPSTDFDGADLANIDDVFGTYSEPETSTDERSNADERAQFQSERMEQESLATILATIAAEGGHTPPLDQSRLIDAFPEAMTLTPTRDATKIQELDAKLASMSNVSLRMTAIATRDASDLSPIGEVQASFTLAWKVLRLESVRRGLDLDTGKRDPQTATDPERAALHTDEDRCPIHVVRKNLARQRVRS